MFDSLGSMDVSCSFLCGLRGYHEYRFIWTPILHETLLVRHEHDNSYDRYAIACLKKLPGHLSESIVGHLPKEIARFTYYIMLHGARLSAKVLDTQHRRSPLVQGGLEIPVEVTIAMECSDKNQLYINKYESLVSEKYKEPVEERLEDATADILRRINADHGEDGIVPEDEDSNSSSESDMEIV